MDTFFTKKIDVKTLSAKLLKAIESQKELAKASPGRGVVDIIRTAFWHAGLLQSLGTPSSYGLVNLLQPESVTIVKGTRVSSGKWTKYASGQHRPQQEAIDLAAKHVPPSRWEIEHVLWDVLRANADVVSNGDNWLRRLKPSVQKILYKKSSVAGEASTRIQLVTNKMLDDLEIEAGLDSLAALTFLLRESVAIKYQEFAYHVAQRLFRMLLILGGEFIARGIGTALFELYVRDIFPLVTWKQRRFELENKKMRSASLCLNLLAYRSLPAFRPASWKQRVGSMHRLLSGTGVLDMTLMHAFTPPYSAGTLAGNANELEEQLLFLIDGFREEAWATIDEIWENGLMYDT